MTLMDDMERMREHLREEHPGEEGVRYADFLNAEGLIVCHTVLHTQAHPMHDHLRYERP